MAIKMKEAKRRKLRHVQVYDRLFAAIRKGEYPIGSKLPSEPELAKQMDVSRMTLRQALSLLQEDGIIKNYRGIGNFVKAKDSRFQNGLEELSHPLLSCLEEEIDEVECEVRLENASDHMEYVLYRNVDQVAVVDLWYKKNKKAIAYSLIFTPLDNLQKYHISIDQIDEIRQFCLYEIYKIVHRAKRYVKISNSGNFTAHKYAISKNIMFYLIEESLFDQADIPVMFMKHYCPIENGVLQINAVNEKLTFGR